MLFVRTAVSSVLPARLPSPLAARTTCTVCVSVCLHQPPVLPGVPVPPPPSHLQVRLRPLPPLPRSSASRLNLQSRGSGELISPKLSDVSAFGLGWWVPVGLLGLCAPVALPAQAASQPPDRGGGRKVYARIFPLWARA